MAYTFLHGITSFPHFHSSLGLATTLHLFRVTGLQDPCSLSMVGNDTIKLAAVEATATLQHRVNDKMATLHAIEKKAVKAHA
jgi:hypothetical protein